MNAARERTREALMAVVLELLETEGFDAVQQREVARRARVSLATVYKLFPSRDELILTTIEQWMAEHCFSVLTPPPPESELGDALIAILRTVLEPWERNGHMLEAWARARTLPGGDRLDQQGFAVMAPMAHQFLSRYDSAYAADMEMILAHLSYAVILQAAAGDIPHAAMLPTLARVVRRLTADNASIVAAAAASPPP